MFRYICWHFPINYSQELITSLIEQMNGTIEYLFIPKRKSCFPFTIFSSDFNGDISNFRVTFKIQKLLDNEILIPSKNFIMNHMNIQKSDLRVCTCTPSLTKIQNCLFYRFIFSTPKERDKIYLGHENFQNDWSHIICFPIATLDPNYIPAANAIFSRWKAIPKDVPKNHLSSCLLTITQDEIPDVQCAINSAIAETNWTCSNRFLSFNKLEHFNPGNNASLLFSPPEGEFTENMKSFNELLWVKLHDIGVIHFEPSKVLHMTFLKSIYLPQRPKSFDSTIFIESFHSGDLPDEAPTEVRLVQRFAKDPDGFYLTISHHPLP